jgi:methionyl-tRNA synthetase
MFLCATDEHGTPAELAAAKTGEAVRDYCARMHDVQAELARGFRLSFDHFGRSSSPENHKLTQHLAGRLRAAGLISEVSEKQVYSNADGRFLPDRYIEGTCPNCGYDRARGDQCENCTKQLGPTDLINPRSPLAGPPIWKCAKPSICSCARNPCAAVARLDRQPKGLAHLTTSIALKWLDDGDGCKIAALPAIWTGAFLCATATPMAGHGWQSVLCLVRRAHRIYRRDRRMGRAQGLGDGAWERWWRTDKGRGRCALCAVHGQGQRALPHAQSFPAT